MEIWNSGLIEKNSNDY